MQLEQQRLCVGLAIMVLAEPELVFLPWFTSAVLAHSVGGAALAPRSHAIFFDQKCYDACKLQGMQGCQQWS